MARRGGCTLRGFCLRACAVGSGRRADVGCTAGVSEAGLAPSLVVGPMDPYIHVRVCVCVWPQESAACFSRVHRHRLGKTCMEQLRETAVSWLDISARARHLERSRYRVATLRRVDSRRRRRLVVRGASRQAAAWRRAFVTRAPNSSRGWRPEDGGATGRDFAGACATGCARKERVYV
jgi:hypothetical protein